MRFYVVKEGDREVLIEANTGSQAQLAYAKARTTVAVAKPADVLRVMQAGGQVVTAGKDE